MIIMNHKTALASLLVIIGAVCARGGDGEGQPLTLEGVRRVWSVQYEYPSSRNEAVSKIFDRIDAERAAGTNPEVVASIEAYLLGEVLKTKAATVDDNDGRIVGEVHFFGRYLMRMEHWGCMRESDSLMNIARALVRFQPLPEVKIVDVMPLAKKVDDYLKYGTNASPRSVGAAKRWEGPAGERVVRVADFRVKYNRQVEKTRQLVLRVCHDVIFDARDARRDAASCQALWDEFLRVAGVEPESGRS